MLNGLDASNLQLPNRRDRNIHRLMKDGENWKGILHINHQTITFYFWIFCLPANIQFVSPPCTATANDNLHFEHFYQPRSGRVMGWVGMFFLFWGRLAFCPTFWIFKVRSCSTISLHDKPQNSFRNGQLFKIFQIFRIFQMFRIFLL